MVFAVGNAGNVVGSPTRSKPIGSRHTGETVHNKRCAFALRRHATCHHLRCEASASIVRCHHAIAVNSVVGNGCQIARFGNNSHVTESSSAHSFLHNIARGHCAIMAQGVASGFPRQQKTAIAGIGERHRIHRQRLHLIATPVALGNKFKHSLVDCTAHDKAERGVETVTHICHIVMRQQFEKHCGHLRHTSLVIRLVPHSAACPVRLELRAYVVADVC